MGNGNAYAGTNRPYRLPDLMHPVVAIAGATGTGKTDLALSVAAKLDGVLLPLDQLHRYKHLAEGTGLDLDSLSAIKHIGYQILSPWEVSGPLKYSEWLSDTLESSTRLSPAVIEGGCTSYLNQILSVPHHPILGKIYYVGLMARPDRDADMLRIQERITPAKMERVLAETEALVTEGFISNSALPLLLRYETLWQHPEDLDSRLAWAVRIAARVYSPAFMALEGLISIEEARQRIVANVLDIQKYQQSRLLAALPHNALYTDEERAGLADDIAEALTIGTHVFRSRPNKGMYLTRFARGQCRALESKR